MLVNQYSAKTYRNGREINQDSYAFMRVALEKGEELLIYAIADGVGSDFQSQTGSSVCTNMILAHLAAGICDEIVENNQLVLNLAWFSLKEGKACLAHIVKKAFAQTQHYMEKAFYANGMKRTTLSIVIFFGNQLLAANLGDSPIYLQKDGQVELLSEIHNVAGENEKENPIYYTKLGNEKRRQDSRRLSRCMGHFDYLPEIFITFSLWEMGMTLAMGSDGAFGELTTKEIAFILSKKKSLNERLDTLLNEASLNTTDNQTAILIQAKEEEEED